MIEIINILRVLMVGGVDEKSLQALVGTYKVNKGHLSDPVRGPSANIEAVVEDSIMFMHVVSSFSNFF
jgi:hypothetical protein